jgi:hypothetical protein
VKFVQVIEFKTRRWDEIDTLMDSWVATTDGKRTASWSISGRDRDRADTYIELVEFPSYDDAMRNNDLSETASFADAIAALCEETTFRNVDVLREDSL